MSVPDLETVPFRVLKREEEYEIRQVESYYVAETTMPGRTGFDFNGSSQSFNVLASYLFGKSADENKWKMSFVMPSKYGPDLPQAKDPSVTIKEVPRKIVAVAAFPGLVTDDDISQRESRLRKSLQKDTQYQLKEDSVVEIAQYNPPFTLPFARRNEIALELTLVQQSFQLPCSLYGFVFDIDESLFPLTETVVIVGMLTLSLCDLRPMDLFQVLRPALIGLPQLLSSKNSLNRKRKRNIQLLQFKLE
ncbi:hypothetical protein TRIUR3_22012 [Triticum urartu]|uniref:Heme-binding-like protein, chloroplastic n=1 Tax=Triticum urartu TaxID=4572 RepID=M7Z8G9_TRIUA|nr:hypothetical protein TRIUR3_22012 [Triticum urartu]